jgi:factor VIII intron 22 protein
MDPNFDYNSAFKAIATKLKRRFLRKPNINEAIDEYQSLSKKLESEECHSLSGRCLEQVAKAYHTIGNFPSESTSLQLAAKQYLKQIESNRANISFGEDLLSVISLYEDAIRLNCDQNERHNAAKLCLELADILSEKFDHYFEAIPYYERSIALFTYNCEPGSSIQSLFVQAKLSTLKVFTCNYQDALTLYSDVCNLVIQRYSKGLSQQNEAKNKDTDTISLHSTSSFSFVNQTQTKPIGFFANILVDSDICKLLLLLLIKPNKLKQDYAITMETYSWFQTQIDSTNAQSYLPASCMNKDLFILLQSFVMATQSNDIDIVKELQLELYPHLNDVQNHLINQIAIEIQQNKTDKLF